MDRLDNNYKELLCAIIKANTDDFIYMQDKYFNEGMITKFKYWVRHCEWFIFLNIDQEYFIEQTLKKRKEVENERKKSKKKADKTPNWCEVQNSWKH